MGIPTTDKNLEASSDRHYAIVIKEIHPLPKPALDYRQEVRRLPSPYLECYAAEARIELAHVQHLGG